MRKEQSEVTHTIHTRTEPCVADPMQSMSSGVGMSWGRQSTSSVHFDRKSQSHSTSICSACFLTYTKDEGMVRISIPNLPSRPIQPLSGLSLLSLKEQAAHLRQFLEDGDGRTLVITGAGVSVESGIRAYRGKAGSYSNPNYK